MTEHVRAYLEQHHGAPNAMVPLKGTLRDGERSLQPVWLVRIGGQIRLAARDGQGGHTVEVSTEALRYKTQLIEDQLVVGDDVFTIPTGRGDEVQRQLACARLGGSVNFSVAKWLVAKKAPLSREDVEVVAFGGLVDSEEHLLCWLQTATQIPVSSSIIGRTQETARLVITDRQAFLLAVGPVGDVVVQDIEAPLSVKGRWGRDHATSGGVAFQVPLNNERSLQEFAPLVAWPRAGRLLEAARIALEHGPDEHLLAETLMTATLETGDPLSVAAAWTLHIIRGLGRKVTTDELGRALHALQKQAPDGESLAVQWERFGLGVDAGVALLEAMVAAQISPRMRLPLHRKVHRALLDIATDFEAAAVDIALVEHLIEAAQQADAARDRQALRQEATDRIEARLQKLPSEELRNLLPSASADLTTGGGGQTFRIRLLELSAFAKGNDDKPSLKVLAELARLQPLVPARQAAVLAEHPGDDLARRTKEVLELLQPGGLLPLAPVDEGEETLGVALLGEKEMEQVRHPVAQKEGPLGKLQAMLAKIDVPDHSALKNYCEKLSVSGSHGANAALVDAAYAFGLKSLQGFISRGDKSVGARAYEGSPPFILLGADHFDLGSSHFLHPWELRFVVGTEVAHLRFGHSRVTADEVWSGAWDKGKVTADFFVGLLPLFKGWKAVNKLAELVARAQASRVGRVLKGAGMTKEAVKKLSDEKHLEKGSADKASIGVKPEELVVAHRVMQLSADRAGLLFCDNLRAAVRAMFLTVPSYAVELPLVEKYGLAKVLIRRDGEGKVLYQDLALSVAALIRFYLSDDYSRLRVALYRSAADDDAKSAS